MNFAEFFPVWDKLTQRQKDTLSAYAVKRSIKKGETLHNGSENCTGLILVLSGQLRAYTISDDGKEITLYRLLDRDICLFSASCMMRSIQFDIIIDAEKDTEIIVIPSEIYKSVMEESAALANYTNEIMASRFSDVMWLMDQVLWKSFDKRLAGFLLEEANIERTDILKITHEAIGNHMGNPREVVTRMLRYFQNEGMVKLSRGTIGLIDKEKIEKIADE
jgi:CRP/FNR family transcriptional regulator